MVYKYKLKEYDVLQYILYKMSKKNMFVEGMINGINRYILISLIICMIFSLLINSTFFIICFLGLIIKFFFVYRYKYRRLCYKTSQETINKNYQNLLDNEIIIKIYDSHIEYSFEKYFPKLQMLKIDTVIETKQYFFLQDAHNILIIPKLNLNGINIIRDALMLFCSKSNGVYMDDLKWKG